MESDVTLARDQPVPMLEYPISFPSLSLSSLMDYDDDETMIFDGLSLPNLKDEHDDESPLSDQMKMKIAETVTDTKSVSSTREQASVQSNLDMWFERGQNNHNEDMTMQESTIHKIIESLGNDSEESITKTNDDTKPHESTIHKIIKSLEEDSEESITKSDDRKPRELAIHKIIESLGDDSNERVSRTHTENYKANIRDNSKSSNFLLYSSNSHENCISVGDQRLENVNTSADSEQSSDGQKACAKDSVLDRNYFEISKVVEDHSIIECVNDSFKVAHCKYDDVSNKIITSGIHNKTEISTRSSNVNKFSELTCCKSNVEDSANDIMNSSINNTMEVSQGISNVDNIANDIINTRIRNEKEVSERSSYVDVPIEFTQDKCNNVEILNDISNIGIINKTDASTRSRKRKQNKPRLIPQETLDNESNDEDSENEWSYVRKKALFSKLYVPKKVRRCRKQLNGDHVLTRCAIIEIIEDSLRAQNDPDTTNRYRRHLMKQSQKSFTSQTDEHEDAESQTNGITSDINEIDHRQIICDDSNRNMAAGDSAIDDMPDNDPLECKRCGKHFTTMATLSAHYEFHRNVEKDFENTHFVGIKANEGDNTQDGLHGDDDEEEESSDSDDSDDSDESEQSASKSREPADGDVLETSTYFCQVCQTRFTNIGALQHHMQEHNTSDGEPVSENEAKGDHYCGVCQKNFASAASLHVHNKIHSGDNPYTCPTCNKSFRDKTRLTTHIRVHTGEKPFVCSICQKSFSQKGNLKLHQKIHTGERNCICQVCGNGFRSRSDLVRHMKVHGLALSSGSENEETTPKVPVTMTITSPPIRLQHESQESQTKFHRSNKIKDLLEANDNIGSVGISPGMKNMNDLHKLGVTSPSLRSRPSHDGLEGYHRNDAFINLVPKYPGIDANAYLMNLNREVEFIKAMTEAKMRSEATSIKSYICPLCGISLPSFDAFNHHVLLQHNPITTFGPIPNSPFGPSKASPAKHTSPSIFSLLDPFLSVPKTDKFKCKDCNEVFHTNEDLTIHSKTHRNKNVDTKGPMLSREHGGPVTSRGQGGPMTSREHGGPMTSQNHGGPVMSRDHGVGSFLSSTAIMEDMKLVSSEKLYSCEFCGKTFRRSHHLQTHMRTHTGDRPYTCVECNKCFARGDHLQNHRRTHTGEKPYRCDICNRSYSQSHHLLRHKRTHTGERPYQCSLCEKTFSRDHHLKKHLETHRDLVDVPEQRETKSEAEKHSMDRLTEASFDIKTRSNNQLGQLMMDMRPEHSASKLMESMIKRHLREEEERKLSKQESTGNYIVGMQEREQKRGQKSVLRKEAVDNYSIGMQEMEQKREHERGQRKESLDNYSVGMKMMEHKREHKREQRKESTDDYSVGSRERDQKRDQRQESLKITDILNDEIDKRMTAHISTDLILDHVMMLGRPKPGVKVVSEPLSHERGEKRMDFAGKYSALEQGLRIGHDNQSPKISDNMSKLSDFSFQSNLFSSQSHISSSASLPSYSRVHSSSSREGIRYEPREGTTTLDRSESREGIHQESSYRVTEHAPSTASKEGIKYEPRERITTANRSEPREAIRHGPQPRVTEHILSTVSREGIRYEPGERIITANRSESREAIHQESPYRVTEHDINVSSGTLHSNRLEPKTLDDIVLKSLQDEYNIKHS